MIRSLGYERNGNKCDKNCAKYTVHIFSLGHSDAGPDCRTEAPANLADRFLFFFDSAIAKKFPGSSHFLELVVTDTPAGMLHNGRLDIAHRCAAAD